MKKDFLNAIWAVKKGEVVSHVFWKDFTTLFPAGILDVPACSKSMRALPETKIHFLIHTKQGGGWGTGGTFQVFLWIMNLPYALNTALLGNLSVCSIRLEFQLHCYLSIQLFLNCLQQPLEVSKNNSILLILCLEISSQDVYWGFTLKCSILIRIPESFVLLCKLNFYFWLLFHRVF